MASITVLKENVPTGPFTRAEVAEKLRAGEFSLESLAFAEGLTAWTPLRDVLAHVDAALAPPIVAAVAAPAAYSYAATMQPPGHLVYAGFWLRFAAIFVDGLILSPLFLISFGLSLISNATDNNSIKIGIAIFMLFYAVFSIVVQWLYFAVQESGVHQATFGKRLLVSR
jgi:hypothetical protein